ncbi:MAG: hypothetical protein Q9M36_16005 [Sulfurovum sp.]|nr:hypothetical protein [Sulfurovum sp.]
MGVRIEIVLLFSIVGIVVGAFNVKLNTEVKSYVKFSKELEFTHTTFREVDVKHLQAIAYGTHGVRDNSILTIADFVYSTEVIESLVAKKATYIGDTIYLEGDVVFDNNTGYSCKTEQAEYDESTEILNITAPYVATRGRNIVLGDTMMYNTRKEEAYGTVIDAVFYTQKK